jgi:hypothetical protein
MALVSAVHVSDEEKLQILRRLDQFRHWHSLNDKRYCLVCGKIIIGHDVQVIGGTRGNGPVRIICPTERCHSIPMDWVLPTAEVLANVALQEKARTDERASHRNRDVRQNSLTAAATAMAIRSRLRKLAARFRRPAYAVALKRR